MRGTIADRRRARHDRGGRLLAAPAPVGPLHEKGGKEHSMPCHHNLETYLQDYLEAAGIAGDREGALFRTTVRRTGVLTDRPMSQSDAWRMLQRRACEAGIPRRSAITPS